MTALKFFQINFPLKKSLSLVVKASTGFEVIHCFFFSKGEPQKQNFICYVSPENLAKVYTMKGRNKNKEIKKETRVCLPFTKSFRKIRLEKKWNSNFRVVLVEEFREQRYALTFEKEVLFSGTGCSKMG